MDREFLLAVLNSTSASEGLQVTAYNILNVAGFQPTDEQKVELISASLVGNYQLVNRGSA